MFRLRNDVLSEKVQKATKVREVCACILLSYHQEQFSNGATCDATEGGIRSQRDSDLVVKRRVQDEIQRSNLYGGGEGEQDNLVAVKNGNRNTTEGNSA